MRRSLSDALHAKGAIENLTLTGAAAINGTGNDLANVITGNAAANLLTGNAGNDTLHGGTGGRLPGIGADDLGWLVEGLALM